MRCVSAFLSNRSGNFAVLAALATLPLLLAAGLGVDFSRQLSAHRNLQEANDAAALALAASREQDKEKLRTLAEKFLAANYSASRLVRSSVVSLEANADRVEVKLDGAIHATFMGLAGKTWLKTTTNAVAERAVVGGAEIALILDNTDSMKYTDAKGVTKIAAVKQAAKNLVNDLIKNDDGAVRVALVPFADNVNIGTANRSQSWLNVPADYATDRKCETKTTGSKCHAYAPKYSCTKVKDGMEYQTTCGGQCTDNRPVEVPPYESCSGGAAYKWYGCIGMRVSSKKPVNDDGSPAVKYPGLLDPSGIKCPTAIIPLTTDKTAILNGIAGMVISRTSPTYTPNTYLPAGVMWGFNVLSPSEPMAQGAAYDPRNQRPRKVAVLMTDGENTKYLNLTGGAVGTTSDMVSAYDNNGNYNKANDEKGQAQVAPTNADTLAMCSNMKKQNIEIFSVAFMVDSEKAKKLLEDCATDPKSHYFDASDSDKLAAAFGNIGNSLRTVRLVD